MAGDASAIRAGRAFVEMGLDSGGLNAGLSAAFGKLRGFGATLSGFAAPIFGVASLGGALAAAKHFAEAGSAMHDMSERTGVAVEELSALKFAAEQSGASVEDLEMGIRKMQKGGFGSGLADMEKIADRIAKIEDPARRTQMAIQVFGKGGTALLPMLKDGAAGLREMRQEAEDAGLVMGTRTADAADALGDAMDKLKAQTGAVVNGVGSALAPVLLDLMKELSPVVAGVISWIRENRILLANIFKIALGLAAVGAAIPLVTTAFGLLFNPLTFWLEFAVGGIGGLALAFGGLGETARQTVGAMADAFRAGDLTLAFNVVIAGLKVGWMGFANFFVDIWAKAVHSAALEMTDWFGFMLPEGTKRALEEDFAREQKQRAMVAKVEMERANADLARLQRQAANERLVAAGKRLEFVKRAPGLGDAGETIGTFSKAGALALAGGAQSVATKIDKGNDILAEIEKAARETRDAIRAAFPGRFVSPMTVFQ